MRINSIFFIYKGKGSKQAPENYRPLTLRGIFLMIFERWLTSKLLIWI